MTVYVWYDTMVTSYTVHYYDGDKGQNSRVDLECQTVIAILARCY